MSNRFFLLLAIIFSYTSVFSQSDLELIRLTLENKYRWVGQFDPETHIATMYNEMLMGYVDINGKEILRLGEYATSDFSDGIGVYYRYNKGQRNYTHYIIDKTGKVLKTVNGLHFLQKFYNGWAIASDSTDNFGLLMLNGKTKIPFQYKYLERLGSKYLLAQDSDRRYGLLDTDGNTIVPFLFAQVIHIDTLSMNVWAYQQSVGYGVFRSTGKLIKELGKDNKVESFAIEGEHYRYRDGLMLIENKNTKELSVVNSNLETVVPFGKYDQIKSINEGRIEISMRTESKKVDGRVTLSHSTNIGFLNYEGKVVIQPDFESAIYFTEGLCAISKGGKWGYIDRNGKVVIPLQYDYCLPFSRGYAKVQLNDKFYIINKSGKTVLNSKPYW